MPKLRRLSGAEAIKILARFGFAIASQRGSHVKLQRVTDAGVKQTLTIPNRYRNLPRHIPASNALYSRR